MQKLYLDDCRIPADDEWMIVRSYDEFCEFVEKNGIPKAISFDHDLCKYHIDWFFENGGFELCPRTEPGQFQVKTGLDCAFWFVGLCRKLNQFPDWVNIHSHNPGGGDCIAELFSEFSIKVTKIRLPHTYDDALNPIKN